MSEENKKCFNPNKLKYLIFPGKYLLQQNSNPLYDKAYRFWKQFWTQVYTEAGSPESLSLDDFLRQEMIAIIVYELDIVAMHLYSLFSLDKQATRDHSYFKFYPPEFFEFMKRNNADYVMSFEFLTVSPSWRKSAVGISMAEVMIGCGVKWAQTLHVDAVIAPARTENKVNTMAYNFGAECFQPGVIKRNIKVDLIVAFQKNLKENPDSLVNQWASDLWNRCENYTTVTQYRKKHEAA